MKVDGVRSPGRGPLHAVPTIRALLAWLAVAAGATAAHAQEPRPSPPPAGDAVRVFVDCERWLCEDDFFRREVPFVDYVLDREDAQVHVLIVGQRTGSGGLSLTLDFIGREDFEGLDDRQLVTIPPDVPEEERQERIARGLAAGLIRYVARTSTLEQIRFEFEGEAGPPGLTTAEDDPWDFWVFRASLSGSYEAEDRQDDFSIDGGLSANRVTEELKIELRVDGEYQEESFDVDSTTTVTSLERNYDFDGLVVRSLGPHWSLGAETQLEHSTFRNRQVSVRVAPALEYNLFRYEDSERKQLTFLYSVGFNSFSWREETVFGETSEVRLDQSLRVSLAVRQPWGEAGGELLASHFLDDIERNRLSAGAFIDLRITRGLSLDLRGQAVRIRDQINLPAGGATPEEVLLELQELQTGFSYEFDIGFSYRFGSIFNNVVNPRFESDFGRNFR
ncbi:MAG: hypothetical protein R3266_02225 [Gemmatimonadota bacterium]|nr:hypothetical protein [Gemmatimonadota bacterium]